MFHQDISSSPSVLARIVFGGRKVRNVLRRTHLLTFRMSSWFWKLKIIKNFTFVDQIANNVIILIPLLAAAMTLPVLSSSARLLARSIPIVSQRLENGPVAICVPTYRLQVRIIKRQASLSPGGFLCQVHPEERMEKSGNWKNPKRRHGFTWLQCLQAQARFLPCFGPNYQVENSL